MFCMCINSIIKGEMLVAPTYSYSIVTHDNAGVVQKTGVNQFHSVWPQQASLQTEIFGSPGQILGLTPDPVPDTT